MQVRSSHTHKCSLNSGWVLFFSHFTLILKLFPTETLGSCFRKTSFLIRRGWGWRSPRTPHLSIMTSSPGFSCSELKAELPGFLILWGTPERRQICFAFIFHSWEVEAVDCHISKSKTAWKHIILWLHWGRSLCYTWLMHLYQVTGKPSWARAFLTIICVYVLGTKQQQRNWNPGVSCVVTGLI